MTTATKTAIVYTIRADKSEGYMNCEQYKGAEGKRAYDWCAANAGRKFESREALVAEMAKVGLGVPEQSAYGTSADTHFARAHGIQRTGMVFFLCMGHMRMGNGFKLIVGKA